MVDTEGKTWYRYVDPTWSYDIHQHTILGCVTVSVEGEVPDYDPEYTKYHLTGDEEAYEEDVFSTANECVACHVSSGGWFDNIAAAEEFKAMQESKIDAV